MTLVLLISASFGLLILALGLYCHICDLRVLMHPEDAAEMKSLELGSASPDVPALSAERVAQVERFAAASPSRPHDDADESDPSMEPASPVPAQDAGLIPGVPADYYLAEEIASALNRYSAENESNTPDFILAKFLLGCLAAWDNATRERERWYGRNPNEGPVGTISTLGPRGEPPAAPDVPASPEER